MWLFQPVGLHLFTAGIKAESSEIKRNELQFWHTKVKRENAWQRKRLSPGSEIGIGVHFISKISKVQIPVSPSTS